MNRTHRLSRWMMTLLAAILLLSAVGGTVRAAPGSAGEETPALLARTEAGGAEVASIPSSTRPDERLEAAPSTSAALQLGRQLRNARCLVALAVIFGIAGLAVAAGAIANRD